MHISLSRTTPPSLFILPPLYTRRRQRDTTSSSSLRLFARRPTIGRARCGLAERVWGGEKRPLVSSRRPRATRHSLDRRCRRRGAPRPALFFSRFFFFFFSHGLVPERARVRDLPCLSLSTVVQELLGGLTEGAAGDVEGLKVLYRRNFGAHYTLSFSF